MSEKAWINNLKAGNREDDVLAQIYHQFFPRISKMVMRYGCSADDAKDIFQEAVIIFYEAVKSDRFRGESRLGTYLYGIARNRMLKRLEADKKLRTAHDALGKEQDQSEHIESFFIVPRSREKRAWDLMLKLGENCQRILIYAYQQQLPMREIAREMGLKNEQVARNKKSRCLRELREQWLKQEEKITRA